jgi:DNA repair protein RecN (Recombination protein N)
MLTELVVHNFAIIRNLEVAFKGGLNVLTGETGAGKSILVGAVNLILGSRASQEMIRTGATEATVEAAFELSKRGRVSDRLASLGLDTGDELFIVRRSINRNGRNRVFINDQQISLQQLQQVARGLISVSGQHEHQLLLDPDLHLGLLDAFGQLDLMCGKVSGCYADWSETREQLNRLKRLKQDKTAQVEGMRFQLQELDGAKLQPNEDNVLQQELNILRHAAALSDAAQTAHQILYAGRGAVLDRLAEVEKNVESIRRIDPAQGALLQQLEESRIQLQDLSHSLQQYAHKISFDPHRLAQIEDRLALIQRLGKKYGGSVDAMLQRSEELRTALGQEEDADLKEEQLQKKLEASRAAYLEKARALSEQRRECAGRLSEEVEKTLAGLDMGRARFAVSFQESGADAEPVFTASGIDRVEFMLSANPGEDLKPLSRIASGGELSRILLALKSLLSRSGEAETLIFDEVDAGIGGRTAELVGLQLERLSKKHQVICITHLPQIACYAEHHYKVAKEVREGETSTGIRLLLNDELVEELARMLGGISISDTTRAHAQELLRLAGTNRQAS